MSKDLNHCSWCGKLTPMEKLQLPETPILEWIEDKIDKAGRLKVWGKDADWSRLRLEPEFEAELLVYDDLLGKVSLKTVCERCLDEDDKLWAKYYKTEDFWDDEF